MQNRAHLTLGATVLVAVLALIFGGIAGAVVGKATTSTKTVKEIVNATSTSPVSNQTSTAPLSWVDIAKVAGPAVVTIINHEASQGTDFFGNPIPGGTAEGSGFIVNTKGDIVTNDHVVAGEQSLQVVFANGRKTSASIVRADQQSDLAVVKVNSSVPATIKFGDSGALRSGEPVMAIGSALGEFRNSVTTGVISATGRSITEPNGVTLNNMLQTDAPINQGNSGGPLINEHGQVIGVNTAINRGSSSTDLFGQSNSVVAEGIGFAIPSNTVKAVVDRLIQNRPTGFLGVQYQQISQQEATYFNFPVGAYVKTVEAGSPAAKAGLKVRDIITAVDGQKLTDQLALEQIVAGHAPGDKLTFTVWRASKTLTITVTLGQKS